MTSADDRAGHGAHLVGSVPLASAEVVFETVAAALGDRVRRIPDGETGPRSDWIVWQLPVFTSRPELEIVPPGPNSWRPLPRVRLEDGVRATACGSRRSATPTPRSPPIARSRASSATGVCRGRAGSRCACRRRWPRSARSSCPSTRPRWRRPTRRACWRSWGSCYASCRTTRSRSSGTPTSSSRCWRASSRSGSPTSRAASSSGCCAWPATCPPTSSWATTSATATCSTATSRSRPTPGDWSRSPTRCAASLGRPLNWIHLPVPRDRADAAYFAPLARPAPARGDRALPGARPPHGRRRGHAAAAGGRERVRLRLRRRHRVRLGPAPPATVPELLRIHHAVERAAPPGRCGAAAVRVAGRSRARAGRGLDAPADRQLRPALRHRREPRLVPQPRPDRGGPRPPPRRRPDPRGLLAARASAFLDRLKLRIFDRQVGLLIADSSPKFLRVAVDKFGEDPRVAFRLLRGQGGGRSSTRGGARPALGARVDRSPRRRDRSLHRPARDARVVGARAAAGGVFIQSGHRNSTPARASGSSTRPCGRSTRWRWGSWRNDRGTPSTGPLLDDEGAPGGARGLSRRVFCRVPLDYYLHGLEGAGFRVEDVTARTIEARVEDWFSS